MKQKELKKHFLDNKWRTYTCGCLCYHCEDDTIHSKEIWFSFNNGRLP